MADFLEDYELLDELGQGAYAKVFKVKHKELGYVRAMRVLNATIAYGVEDSTYRKFLDECRLLLRLNNGNHPNIVHIYPPRLVSQKAFVEMDYVEGSDLTTYLRDNKYFIELQEILNFLNDIGSALSYCHVDVYKYCMDRAEDCLEDDPDDGSKVLVDEATYNRLVGKYRIIHNDLHSGNVIRRTDGKYILLDFGLAVDGNEVIRSSRRKHGGAPEFKAPEKWNDETILTTQSDIYSFGIMLYELLAGRVPFPYDVNNRNSVEAEYLLSKAHCQDTPPAIFPLRQAAYAATHHGETLDTPDYPAWLEEVILKCLAKDPRDRFANAKELYDYVQKFTSAGTAFEVIELRNQIKSLEQDKFELTNLIAGKDDIINQLKQELQFKQIELEKLRSTISFSGSSKQSFVERVNGVEIPMIYVPAGSFTMGATSEQGNDGEGNESPTHQVTLNGYYIGATEITQAQWEAVMGYNPSHFLGENLPVECVSYDDALSFCRRLSELTGKCYTLPTESQWEYAARGARSGGTKYSGSNALEDVAWYLDNSNGQTHPVGTKSPNALGLYDMSGNVWEWCLDCYGAYPSQAQTNPQGPTSGDYRVLRGGSWYYFAEYCRVSCRYNSYSSYRSNNNGFRVVLL